MSYSISARARGTVGPQAPRKREGGQQYHEIVGAKPYYKARSCCATRQQRVDARRVGTSQVSAGVQGCRARAFMPKAPRVRGADKAHICAVILPDPERYGGVFETNGGGGGCRLCNKQRVLQGWPKPIAGGAQSAGGRSEEEQTKAQNVEGREIEERVEGRGQVWWGDEDRRSK